MVEDGSPADGEADVAKLDGAHLMP
jgi:hypothetical protein